MYNLVYINTHDTGRSISPYGYNAPTDNLLEFAMEATVFTQAYCCAPTCSPSRSALLTGQYPHQNGMMGLGQRGFYLYEPEHHLASFLKRNGFRTALSGVQHEHGLYTTVDVEGIRRLGYEEVLTVDSSPYKDHRANNLYIWDRENALKAVEYIESQDGSRPFYLAYGMNATHREYPDVDPSIDERYVKPAFPGDNNPVHRTDEARFMTSALYADENVGLILDALKKKEFYDNTIIIFTTDHGVANPYQKCHLNDYGIGVSLIIRNPEVCHGSIYDGLVSHIDIYPTICDLLGLEKPDYLEGVSLVEPVRNGEKARDMVFAEINFHTSYEPARCVRTERYKYIRYFDETWLKTNLSNIDESVQKSFLMNYGLADRRKYAEALYDCYYDPSETRNVIEEKEYAETVEMLRKALLENMIATDDPLLKGELEVKPYYKVNLKHCVTASSKDPKDYDPRGRH